MDTYPVAMESGAMLMAIPASSQPYAGVEAGVPDAYSRNSYTSISHVKMLIGYDKHKYFHVADQ